jgi:hypothetical protein
MKKSVSLFFLILFLLSRSFSQIVYQYCYIPATLDPKGVSFTVSSFDPNNITKTVFSVAAANNKPIARAKFRFLLNSLNNGQVLDIGVDTTGHARLTYDPFRTSDSLLVFVIVNDNLSAGPIRLYKFPRGVNSPLEQACNNRNSNLVRFVPNPFRHDTALASKLVQNKIAPNRDALELMRLLNYSVKDSANLSADYKIVYPKLPPLQKGKRKLFRKEFKMNKKPDKRLAAQFGNLAATLHNVIDSFNRTNPGKTAVENQAKNNLMSLDQQVNATLQAKNKINHATLVQLNQQISLMISLVRRARKPEQFKGINLLQPDIAHLIAPYHSKNFSSSSIRRQGTFSTSVAMNADIEPENEKSFMPYFDETDASLRRFNFYIFRVDTVISNGKKIPRLNYDAPELKGFYDVYCVPEGMYELYQNQLININDLSTYKSSTAASVGNKDLRLGFYYFFAVFTGDPLSNTVSTPEKFNTENIPKNSGSLFTPLPYAFCIRIKK